GTGRLCRPDLHGDGQVSLTRVPGQYRCVGTAGGTASAALERVDRALGVSAAAANDRNDRRVFWFATCAFIAAQRRVDVEQVPGDRVRGYFAATDLWAADTAVAFHPDAGGVGGADPVPAGGAVLRHPAGDDAAAAAAVDCGAGGAGG